MRNNQPITQEEYVIPRGLTLVSKTDLQGNITEVNDAFEIASGFTRKELIGQPHNMVRHPDVPEAVFKDLWATLKINATWSQVVKNRRKDGGFYWVRANVSPIFQNGQPIGYISFRTEVSDAEKNAASQAYRDIKAGAKKIQYSKVYSGVNWQELNLFAKLDTQWQFTLLMTVFGLMPMLAAYFLANDNPLAITGASLLMLISAFWYGSTALKNQLSIQKALRNVAANEPIEMACNKPTHLIGKLIVPTIATSIAVRYAIEESLAKADEAAKLQTAIDEVSSNLMITDTNANIIYMNKNMVEFMQVESAVFQEHLTDFDPKAIIGSNLSSFHLDQAHFLDVLKTLKSPCLDEIQFGDVHIEINVIPVYNRAGIRTGILAEWRDKSQEMRLLNQINDVVSATEQGILSSRINTGVMAGTMQQISQAMNDMLDTTETSINAAINVSVDMSESKLTSKIEGEYLGRFAVLQDSINVAVDNLASIMAQTKLASQAVTDGANEIKHASANLNDRTQNQAAAIEQTAASMEQMTAAVRQNAENAEQVGMATNTVRDQADKGVKTMDLAVESMGEIHASSQKINDIISLIDSIAFQTNLLALNAAVEAARAGDHGRGFAVVAGEVRNLSAKSAEAAKDIRTLIEDTVAKVSEGTLQVKASGEALNEIASSINEVNKMVEEITRSTREQAEGISQVNQAIASFDSTVQQNAALVEEQAATSEELGSVASLMDSTVSVFKLSKPARYLGSSAETGNFDFSAARRAHRQWRVKVRAYVNDINIDFDRNTAADGYVCDLGKWIYGPGKNFAHSASYIALEKGHAELHAFIGQVLQMKDVGDAQGANEAMSKLENLSNHVVELIEVLEEDLMQGVTKITQATHAIAYKSDPSQPAAPQKMAIPNKSPVQKIVSPGKNLPKAADEWDEF